MNRIVFCFGFLTEWNTNDTFNTNKKMKSRKQWRLIKFLKRQWEQFIPHLFGAQIQKSHSLVIVCKPFLWKLPRSCWKVRSSSTNYIQSLELPTIHIQQWVSPSSISSIPNQSINITQPYILISGNCKNWHFDKT